MVATLYATCKVTDYSCSKLSCYLYVFVNSYKKEKFCVYEKKIHPKISHCVQSYSVAKDKHFKKNLGKVYKNKQKMGKNRNLETVVVFEFRRKNISG